MKLGMMERVQKAGEAHSATKIGVCPIGFVEAILPLNHHAQVLVVQDHHLDVQLLDVGRGQLLAVHHEGSVAIYVHHNLRGQAPHQSGISVQIADDAGNHCHSPGKGTAKALAQECTGIRTSNFEPQQWVHALLTGSDKG